MSVDLRVLAQRLGTVEHFRGLSVGELLSIVRSGQIKRYANQEVIFVEDEPSQGLFVLLKGRVQLCKLSPQGQISILCIFEPVIMFNEVSAVDRGPTPATAIALEDCIIWRMAPEDLEALILHHPKVGVGLLRVLARRNRKLVDQFQDLSFRSVLARAAKLLLEISRNGEATIDRRRYPNHQLAALISTVPEAFSRSLRLFKESGKILVTPRLIEVIQPLHLKLVAQIGPVSPEGGSAQIPAENDDKSQCL